MPWGSRPSMAALTRLGARNASEILMLTLRALHPSRLAMLSAVAFGLVVSSSSQRRATSDRRKPMLPGFPSGSGEAAAVEFLQAQCYLSP